MGRRARVIGLLLLFLGLFMTYHAWTFTCYLGGLGGGPVYEIHPDRGYVVPGILLLISGVVAILERGSDEEG